MAREVARTARKYLLLLNKFNVERRLNVFFVLLVFVLFLIIIYIITFVLLNHYFGRDQVRSRKSP